MQAASVVRGRCSLATTPAQPHTCPIPQLLSRPLKIVKVSQHDASNESSEGPTSDSVATGSLRKGFQPRKAQSSQPTPPSSAASKLEQLGSRVIMGTDLTEEGWREVDKKVNKYPGFRTFTAIGTGGDSFRQSMVQAIEKTTGPVHVECVSQRPSSKGSYISVRIGPVVVKTPEQVIQIFASMREDPRLKWYM